MVPVGVHAKKKFEESFFCGVSGCVPDENTTKLRLQKPTKDRLNRISKAVGFSAELLADLLLTEAFDQIEDDLMPTTILTHVIVARKRAGKRVVESHTEAIIDRFLVASGKPPLSDQIDEAIAAEQSPATPIEHLYAKEVKHQSAEKVRYRRKKF